MEHPVRLNRILLVLLTTVCATQGIVVKKTHTALKPGQNVTGKIVETNSPHILDSSRRCLLEDLCIGCTTTDDNHYVIIHRRNTEQEKQMLVSHAGGAIFTVYSSGSIPDLVGWSEPAGWTGPDPVLYWSFDNLDGLILIEKTQQVDYDALTDGKVNKALALDSREKQWVDLGIQTQACLVAPETCGGTSGAAVAFWVYLHNCAYYRGIISSTRAWLTKETEFRVYCDSWRYVRFYVTVEDFFFHRSISKVEDVWIHLVINYVGPRNYQGFDLFQDGTLVEGTQYELDFDFTPGDGSLVLGKRYVDEDDNYTWIDLDEQVFFNRKLTATEVMKIYNNEN